MLQRREGGRRRVRPVAFERRKERAARDTPFPPQFIAPILPAQALCGGGWGFIFQWIIVIIWMCGALVVCCVSRERLWETSIRSGTKARDLLHVPRPTSNGG